MVKGLKVKGLVVDVGIVDILIEVGVLSLIGIERMMVFEDYRWFGMFLRIIVVFESDISYRYLV